MRGSPRNIAILLALCALAVTGVAGSAEAKGGGSIGAAAAKVSRGTQIRLNRMKTKMALRTRGALQQKTRRQLRLGKRKMMRAMSRREVGLHGSESARARSAFARDIDTGHRHDANTHDEAAPETFSDHTAERREEASGAKQGKKMRDRARRRAESEHKKRRR
ncbi:MAG TPA: hypothetical protein VIG06_27735 [Kofleriaceae bacterium]|jgi:hypothetical protein